VIGIVEADLGKLAAEYRETRARAADSGDSTTEALFADALARLEKQLWMLDVSSDK
jgi:DNA-binding ferritin-like protein